MLVSCQRPMTTWTQPEGNVRRQLTWLLTLQWMTRQFWSTTARGSGSIWKRMATQTLKRHLSVRRKWWWGCFVFSLCVGSLPMSILGEVNSCFSKNFYVKHRHWWSEVGHVICAPMVNSTEKSCHARKYYFQMIPQKACQSHSSNEKWLIMKISWWKVSTEKRVGRWSFPKFYA
jgi:hypothetical protein